VNEWDTIWQNCTYATFFHSREWAEIWEVYKKGKMKPDPKLFEFSDGLKALLPLSRQTSFLGLTNSYFSSPAGTFGGWISLDNLKMDHARLLVSYMVGLGHLTWRLNPYNDLACNSGAPITREDETHTLNLSHGFDDIFRKMTKGHRSAVRKAIRSGVEIKIATTLEDWKYYYQVYQDSLQRWGDRASSHYGWEMFHEMHRRHSPNIKLWLATHSDQIVAGALCFYSLKQAIYWHGAGFEEFFNMRPVNLIICEAIKEACKQGYSWFDFNPSGPKEGVKNFKKSFGAQPSQCGIVQSSSKIHDFFKIISPALRKK